jgi:exodeoxyribonuclease VII large subunit
VTHQLREATTRIARIESRLVQHHPRHELNLRRERLSNLTDRLMRASRSRIAAQRAELDTVAARLTALDPHAVLRRGYTITTRKKDGGVIRSAAEVRAGEPIVTQFADGTVQSIAGETRQMELFQE